MSRREFRDLWRSYRVMRRHYTPGEALVRLSFTESAYAARVVQRLTGV